jgi:hypothetical protein
MHAVGMVQLNLLTLRRWTHHDKRRFHLEADAAQMAAAGQA